LSKLFFFAQFCKNGTCALHASLLFDSNIGIEYFRVLKS
jgi:hypothetical protein